MIGYPFTTNPIIEIPLKNFEELQLNPLLMRAISELGYEKPSPIQEQAIPTLLEEPTDFLGLAATGTGKTAAFSIPMIEKIDPAQRKVQALIICPTRELALQVSGQINLLGKHMGVRALSIYGGSDYSDQIRGLKQGIPVVVGTPGRLVDHMNRGTLRLDELQLVILDEADEMISMGFKEDLEILLGNSPRESSNIWLFSATMSPEVRKVADEYLRNPRTVQVNRTEMLSKTVEQFYYMTKESNKPEVLCKLVDAADDFYGIVFCQTKSLVTDLTQYLSLRKYKVDCLHGDKDQNSREKTMQSFRDRKVNILICTDVASRGLDVKDVTHVINYSLPRELDHYVHRIGRTARSGKTGFAMNLVTPSHKGLIRRIETMTKSRMSEGKIPTRKEIGAKKVSQLLVKFQAQNSYSRAIDLLDQPWRELLAQMSQEEIAGRLLSMMFPEVFDAQYDREPKSAPVAGMVEPGREYARAGRDHHKHDKSHRGHSQNGREPDHESDDQSYRGRSQRGRERDHHKPDREQEKPNPWHSRRGRERDHHKLDREHGKPNHGHSKHGRERDHQKPAREERFQKEHSFKGKSKKSRGNRVSHWDRPLSHF